MFRFYLNIIQHDFKIRFVIKYSHTLGEFHLSRVEIYFTDIRLIAEPRRYFSEPSVQTPVSFSRVDIFKRHMYLNQNSGCNVYFETVLGL